MNLQTTFYLVGIIGMTLYIILLITIVVLLFYIKKKITELHKSFDEKFELVKFVASHPKETAATVAGAVADTAIKKASEFLNPTDEE